MDKYEALRSGLKSLIDQMQGLVANGDYKEDEPMEKTDVEDAMEDAKESMVGGMESPLHSEMQDFFKKKNVGSRPKGLRTIMVEAKVAKPMDMGFKKGKK